MTWIAARSWRRLVPSAEAVLHWLRELTAPVAVVYEAGPTGFDPARQLAAAGVRCVVAAPSKLQRPAADRVKTDAHDALHLARLLRMDQIVKVRVPSVAQEAARDLVRAREDVRGDLMRCRHRLSKLLLRHGIVYSGGQAWTGAHEAWPRGQHFTQRGIQLAFDADLEAMLLTLDRRDRLGKAITEMAADGEYAAVVRRLGCLRGVSTLTAFGLAVEIGDWHRFTGATIGAYLGRVPTESSSGAQRSQGSITKAGNTHARAGNHRLHQRWQTFVARKKKPVIANVAVARELAGWCWSLGGPRRLKIPPGDRPPTWGRADARTRAPAPPTLALCRRKLLPEVTEHTVRPPSGGGPVRVARTEML